MCGDPTRMITAMAPVPVTGSDGFATMRKSWSEFDWVNHIAASMTAMQAQHRD